MLLREYVEIVRRRIWVVVICIVLVPAAWLALDSLVDVRHEATVAVLVSPNPAASGGQVENLVRAQDLTPSYADLVTRRPVMDAVARSGASPISVDELIKSTEARVVADTSVIEITVSAASAEAAITAANSIADTFVAVTPSLTQSEIVSLSVVERAIRASEVGPSYIRDILLGLFFGLVLGLVAAFAINEIDTRPRTRHDLQLRFPDISVLAVVPDLDRQQRTRLLANDEPGSEAFAMLRSAIGAAADDQSQVLLVTSPTSEEGKTTVATNLAASIAARRTVSLIDADLHHPSSVERLGPGTESTGRDWLTKTTSLPNLRVYRPAASASLDTDRLATMIHGMRNLASTTIIDAPPVLPLADTDELAAVADGILVVVRAGSTTAQAIDDTLDRLRRTGTPIVGFVLTRARSEPGYYGQYHR